VAFHFHVVLFADEVLSQTIHFVRSTENSYPGPYEEWLTTKKYLDKPSNSSVVDCFGIWTSIRYGLFWVGSRTTVDKKTTT
jgi:hypothetical protein